jgi:tRNA 2-thiouridine synthesizing protein A
MADQMLDAQGLSCPLPVLEAKKALKNMAAGATLQILATDPAAPADFQAFCRRTGNELMESKQDGNLYTCVIRRSA